MSRTVQRAAVVFVAPLAILAVAYCFGPPIARHLPSSLAGLQTWGPAMALFLSAALALTFSRGRVLFAALSLACAYLAYHLEFKHGLAGPRARLVFDAVCVLIPLNLTALSVARERGIFTLYGARRVALIALQAAAVVWIASGEHATLHAGIHRPLLTWLPARHSPVPHIALIAMAAGTVIAACCAALRRCALEAGMAGASFAFAIGAHTVFAPAHFAVYVGAGAAMLAVAVLQDTFRLAFRDELTGLPSRRALNERLLTLGNAYTIAMVDVDHFKRFNDTHGHVLGDHVLRMVAAKLAQVGGGGRAYRFGGEEFVVLFPGRRTGEVWSHLDALRRDIAAHSVVARDPLREKQAAQARSDRGKRVSVTVSVGVAERNSLSTTADAVLRAADCALYRAKDKGRNCLSR